MWGPVLGWCALQLLAESIDRDQPERAALDLFDRLRLREPFAHAFAALGFAGEESWRVAARVKVLLLNGAGVGRDIEPETPSGAESPAEIVAAGAPGPDFRTWEGKTAPTSRQPKQEQVALAPILWLDPDVRWLCGVHESEGHFYLIRELYEELLWWLFMPSLLRLAGEAAPSRAVVEELSKTVAAALYSAEAAGYRVDVLLGTASAADASKSLAVQAKSAPADKKPRRRKK
jgi:hypothetical protein